jgi:hypothetical protein
MLHRDIGRNSVPPRQLAFDPCRIMETCSEHEVSINYGIKIHRVSHQTKPSRANAPVDPEVPEAGHIRTFQIFGMNSLGSFMLVKLQIGSEIHLCGSDTRIGNTRSIAPDHLDLPFQNLGSFRNFVRLNNVISSPTSSTFPLDFRL